MRPGVTNPFVFLFRMKTWMTSANPPFPHGYPDSEYFMIHNQDLTSFSSVDGTMHSFQFVYFLQSSGVPWLNCTYLYCAKQKSTVTPEPWVCINFIFDLKDLAGHVSLCAHHHATREWVYSHCIYKIHFICCWNCVWQSILVNYFIENCSCWVERILNI